MSKRALPKDVVTIKGIQYRVKKSFALPVTWTTVLRDELLNMKYIERIGA